jgi:16S rRNA (cytidine1402-2'-O)-methyltransferase
VCRELTKRFEEVATGSAAELAERFALPVKGEVTLVIGPSQVGEDRQPARDAVAELVAAGTPRRVAADVVARLTDTSRNDLYRTTL